MGKYIRVGARPLSEQIAHEIDKEVLRDLRKLAPKEEKVMELSLHNCVFGPILIGSEANTLLAVELGEDVESCYRNFFNKWSTSGVQLESRQNKKIVQQVLDSVNTGIIDPSLQVGLYKVGTYFQHKVWKQLQEIRPGDVMTYQDIATAINRERSARAIGNACNANPIAVIVPCHRAIRSDGKTGGYKWGEELKQKLLDRERFTTTSSHQPQSLGTSP